MVQYETYQSNAGDAASMRRWVFAGLLVSLGLHAALLVFFYQHRLEGFAVADARIEPSPVFKMKQVTMPNLETTEKVTIQEKPSGPAPIEIPSEKPQVSEITIAPQIQEVPKEIFTEKPKVEASGDKAMLNDAASRAEMEKTLTGISQAILKEGPAMPRQKTIPMSSGSGSAGGKGDYNVSIPGMSTIDNMLDKAGSLRAGDRAGMPGGALFEYDSFALREEAVGALRKLGTLIQRNPNATFSIEGHTDSFGSPDYNMKLSLDRAEAVKNWLVINFNVSPGRIQTRGFGSEKLIVPATESQEKQAPNRRVELVVKTNAARK